MSAVSRSASWVRASQFGRVKVLKRRLDGPAAGGDDLPRGGSPGRRQGEATERRSSAAGSRAT